MRAGRIAAAAAVTMAATLLAAPGSATPTWVNAPNVANTGDQVTQLHVASIPEAAAPSGSLLVWANAATNDVVASQRPAGGAWAAPVALAKPATAPRIETVKPYNDGRSHVLVTYRVGTNLQTVTYHLSPVTGEAPVTAPATLSSTYVEGTASGFEDALVWAEDVTGGQQRLVGKFNDSLSVLEAPAAVTYRSTASALVTDGDKDARVYAWVAETAGGAQQLYVKRHDGGAAVALGQTGSTFSGLEFDASGDLAWVEKPAAGVARIRVAQVKVDGTATVADVPGGPGAAADPSVAKLAGSGRLLVWREQDGNTWSIRTSTAPPVGGAWTAATTLATGTGTLAARQFSATSSSAGQVVSWCATSGADCAVRGSFRAGKSWGKVTGLGTVANADNARLARSTPPALPRQDAPAAAWTAGGDDISVSAIDHVGPRVSLGTLPVATFTKSVSTSWSAVDDWSKVTAYQLQTSIAGPRDYADVARGDVSWSTATPTTATSRRLPVTPGRTRCVRIVGTDAAVNSGVSQTTCAVAPLDDRNLLRSKGWAKVSDPKSHEGTLLSSYRRGATLALRDYPFTNVLVLVRRIPAGGTIEVTLDGRRIRTLSTAGTSRRMVALPAPPLTNGVKLSHKKRDLRITVISRGKQVVIDGLFVGSDLPRAKDVNLLTR